MKLSAVILLAALLAMPVLATAAEGPAQAPRQKPEAIIAEDKITECAAVKCVDPEKKIIILKLADGRERNLILDSTVGRLDRLRAGDLVKAVYYEKMPEDEVKEGDEVEIIYHARHLYHFEEVGETENVHVR